MALPKFLKRQPFSLDTWMSADDLTKVLAKEVNNGFQLADDKLQAIIDYLGENGGSGDPGGTGGTGGTGGAGGTPINIKFGRTEEINFRWPVPVPPLTAVRVRSSMSYSCYITKVTRHWPPGCMALVDMGIGVGSSSIFPNSGFLALDDATPVFEGLAIYVPADTEIWMAIQNADAVFTHSPQATVTVMEVIRA